MGQPRKGHDRTSDSEHRNQWVNEGAGGSRQRLQAIRLENGSTAGKMANQATQQGWVSEQELRKWMGK